MPGPRSIRGAALRRLSATVGVAVAALVLPTIGLAAAKPPDLGTAGGYALVANTTITNTGVTLIDGNLALVGPSVTGFGPGVITGKKDIGNAAANAAEADVLAAHHDATDAAPVTEMAGDLGGQTLVPGVYHFGVAATLHGTLTLDGQGKTNPLFIFQIGSTLTTGTGASVVLTRGAAGCAVFWAVGSSATIGTATSLTGQPDGPRQHHHEHRRIHRRRRRAQRRPGIRPERSHHPRHEHGHPAFGQLRRADSDAGRHPAPDTGPDLDSDRFADPDRNAQAHADLDECGTVTSRGIGPGPVRCPGRPGTRRQSIASGRPTTPLVFVIPPGGRWIGHRRRRRHRAHRAVRRPRIPRPPQGSSSSCCSLPRLSARWPGCRSSDGGSERSASAATARGPTRWPRSGPTTYPFAAAHGTPSGPRDTLDSWSTVHAPSGIGSSSSGAGSAACTPPASSARTPGSP